MPLSTYWHRLASAFTVVLAGGFFTLTAQTTPPASETGTPFDTLRWQAEDEIRRTQDPALGRVPYERLNEARAELTTNQLTDNQTGIPNVTWQERGPTNVGGPTRAVLFDLSDPARKKAWAGSVGGGLWYTNDITVADSSWHPVSDSWENLNISALAADPSNPQVMYAGTGDGFGSYYAPNGGGIWRTANGGTTWTRLTSTIPASAGTPRQIGFGSIMKLVVNTSGAVFAATRYGVMRSTDGGNSWQFVLAPQQGIGGVPPLGTSGASNLDDFTTDLEIGSDNIVYAAFRNGRLFRANAVDGTAWTEITPPNTAPYNGTRAELALAPSTSGSGQVVYAITTFYNSSNYSADVKWFSKSVNGGGTWTSASVPAHPYQSGAQCTAGIGNTVLILSVAPDNAAMVYLGTSYGLWFRTSDSGQNWSFTYGTSYRLYAMSFRDNKTAIWSGEAGPSYLADFSSLFASSYTSFARVTNYRTAVVSAVSLRNAVNSSYTFLSTDTYSCSVLTRPGAAPTDNSVYFNQGIPYLDQDQSAIGLTYAGNQSATIYNLTTGSSTNKTFPNYYTYNFVSDYDSQNNVFYAYQGTLQKITGVGTSNQVVSLPTSVNGTPQCIKVGKSVNTVFIAGPTGLLYKVTNTDQTSPTLIRIDNDALPATANINCIEVGADDNELLVVLSNYGVRSVWYTSNGGQNWISKDESGHGLPDMPIRWALFNPANRKQVMLATELGIWSTTDITAANPGWQPTQTGMPAIRCNMLRHRTADGRVVVATQGRGVWETNVWATAYTLPTLTIAGLSSTSLCVAGTVSVTVAVTNGTMSNGNTYSLYLSDANGSFANAYKLTTGTGTALTATLPTYISSVSLVYGTNYRLKVTASDPEIETAPSNPITIGTVTYVTVITRELPNYSGFTVCPGSTVDFFANFSGQRDLPGQYEWRLNGNLIANAANDTITVSQPGTYQLIFRQGGCQAVGSNTLSNSTAIYGNPSVTNGGSPPGAQCDGQRTRLVATYAGNSAVFQWQRNGVAIPGATQYAYEATQTGVYGFTVRDGTCQNTVAAGGTLLQFGQTIAATILASSSPVCPGYSAYISVQDVIPANTTFQWQSNGSDIAGATSYYYYGSAGVTYTLKVAQGNCRAVSNPVLVQTGVPTITLSGVGKKQICTGDVRTLYCNVGGPYQWQKNGVDIPGATSYNYSVTSSGTYRVRVGSGTCSGISPEATYQVGSTIVPDISVSGGESCGSSTNPAFVSTSSTSTATYAYQWSRDGVDIPGATQFYYYADRAGTYGLRATGGGCSGTAYVSVRREGLPKPTISTTGSAQRCSGSAVRLLGSYYNGNASYQWKRYGVPIPGATNYYSYYAVEDGYYTLAMRQATCETESDPIYVQIGNTSSAYLRGNALVSAGQAAQLPIYFSGALPWSFTLSNGQTVQNTYANPYFISVAPSATTTYTLASVNNSCGMGYGDGSAQVRVGSGSADVSLAMQVSNRTPAVNDLVSYSATLTNAGPQTAQNVQVTSRLPAGLAFVDSPSAAVRVIDSVLTIDAGDVQVGLPLTYSFRARATQAGVFVHTAQVAGSATPDPDSQPDSGTGDGQDDAAQVDFRTLEPADNVFVSGNRNQTPLPILQSNQPVPDPGTADLSVSLQLDNRTPNAGSNDIVTATLTVSNRGGSAATSVAVQLELPNGAFDYQNPPGWTPVTTDKLYNGFINAIPAGGSVSLRLRWQPSGSGVVKAQILDMSETDSDSTPGNGTGKGEDDEASADVSVR